MERYNPISGEDLYAAALKRMAATEAENARLEEERDGLSANLITANKIINSICEERDALKEQVARLTAQSLLRSATTQPLDKCYCKPGQCMAPIIRGRQMPCLDPEKAARASLSRESSAEVKP